MERKLKIGDTVRITNPKETEGTCWVKGMEYYIGMVSRINCICCENAYLEDIALVFPLSSLILIEEVDEQPTEKVINQIDWEQRRWDLASKLYAEMENITLESAVRQSEIFIKYYKQTLK